MKAFVKSQFGNCSLVWMFHRISLSSKIDFLHESHDLRNNNLFKKRRVILSGMALNRCHI